MALKLQYANSVTPIETVALLDSTNVLTSIYSHADKSYGGGKTIDPCVGIVVNNNYQTTVAVVTLGTAAVNNTIFITPTLAEALTIKGIGVFIKKAGIKTVGGLPVEVTGTPDVTLTLSTLVIPLSGIGDGIFVPLSSLAQGSISIKSSSAETTAIVEIIAIHSS